MRNRLSAQTHTDLLVYGLYVDGGPIRYVGLTTRPLAERINEHRLSSAKGIHRPVYDWIRKHGDQVQTAVLCRCQSVDELREAESFWIAKLNTHVSKGGLNLTTGGEGVSGYEASSELRQRRSLLMKQKNPMDNEESRRRVSKSLLGHSVSDRVRQTTGTLARERQHSKFHAGRGLISASCPLCVREPITTKQIFANHVRDHLVLGRAPRVPCDYCKYEAREGLTQTPRVV